MEEKKEFKLFREKSLEAVESPESLNDYLRVTSPGVWLVLAAVAALLIGAILWSIFGRINTTLDVAVIAEDGQSVCVVPYDALQGIGSLEAVTVNGYDYMLLTEEPSETVIISEDTSPYIRVAGQLQLGDVAVRIPMEGGLKNGIYQGKVVTESLRPISLLLQ